MIYFCASESYLADVVQNKMPSGGGGELRSRLSQFGGPPKCSSGRPEHSSLWQKKLQTLELLQGVRLGLDSGRPFSRAWPRPRGRGGPLTLKGRGAKEWFHFCVPRLKGRNR